MGKAAISYAEASSRYPQQVQEVIDRVEKGCSRLKGTDPTDWSWSIVWAAQVGPFASFDHICRQACEESFKTVEQREAELQERLKRSYDERLQDYNQRCHGICLFVNTRGASWTSTVITDVPKEICEHIRPVIEQSMEQDKIFAQLSPGERRKKIIKMLERYEDIASITDYAAKRYGPNDGRRAH